MLHDLTILLLGSGLGVVGRAEGDEGVRRAWGWGGWRQLNKDTFSDPLAVDGNVMLNECYRHVGYETTSRGTPHFHIANVYLKPSIQS